jgi:hypothetical protein
MGIAWTERVFSFITGWLSSRHWSSSDGFFCWDILRELVFFIIFQAITWVMCDHMSATIIIFARQRIL